MIFPRKEKCSVLPDKAKVTEICFFRYLTVNTDQVLLSKIECFRRDRLFVIMKILEKEQFKT